MMLAVGIVPAWMEILKLNIPNYTREKVFSYTQAFAYMGGGLLPFFLGHVLDGHYQAWRWLFPLAAVLGLMAFFFQCRILIPIMQSPFITSDNNSIIQTIIQPWKTAWNLVQRRVDFQKFQIGFMLVGTGLMIMQPALPIFFVDVLHLSYTKLAIALTLCKGAGFALVSPIWARWINRVDVYRLSSWIAALGCLFPLCILLAQFNPLWLYIGYLIYGVMQSGNELTWNMSGPIFSKQEDSSAFTSVNVLAVGLRGCLIPALGSLLCSLATVGSVMWIGGILCLLATFRFLNYSKKMYSLERLSNS
jgi:predicted MFS family arabinose efflux permease